MKARTPARTAGPGSTRYKSPPEGPGAADVDRTAAPRALVRKVDEARWALEVHRTSLRRASSIDFAQRLLDAIEPSGGPTA
jgi:hypothetical protein